MKNKEVVPVAQPEASPAPAIVQGATGISNSITQQDIRFPRVVLLQSLSPQVVNGGDIYRPGMFIDTLTQEILKQPLTFIPTYIFANVVKWKPRSEGGGMLWKTAHPTAEQLKESMWDGTEKPTAARYINAICLVPGMDIPLIISFCKTSLKAGQDLATLTQLSGKAWKFTYTLESVKVSNSKGTYYVLRVKRGLPSTPAQIVEAEALCEQVSKISIDVDYVQDDTSTESTEPTEF